MVKGDPGAESVFYWDKQRKGVDRRGAGPMKPTLFGRGAGEGLGVHICTGPVAVREAEPGDILEVRILDVKPRPCANPQYKGKSFGSNAAAWWGFHYKELLTEPKPREVITIYEVDASGRAQLGQGGLQLPLDAADRSVRRRAQDHRLPRRAGRPHDRAGEPGRAQEHPRAHPPALRRAAAWRPKEADMVDSIPPSYTGGNIDDWRIGKGATMYYPVAVHGRAALGGRSARLAGRLRAVRHRHRVLAHRHLPAHRAQAREPGRHRAGEPRLPAAGDAGRVGAPRLQLSRTTWPSWAPKRRARSTRSRRSTWPCATRSARCATS